MYIVKFWMCPPPPSKFVQFHAVFGKIWQTRMLAPSTPRVGTPTSGKSWICHWITFNFILLSSQSWPINSEVNVSCINYELRLTLDSNFFNYQTINSTYISTNGNSMQIGTNLQTTIALYGYISIVDLNIFQESSTSIEPFNFQRCKARTTDFISFYDSKECF